MQRRQINDYFAAEYQYLEIVALVLSWTTREGLTYLMRQLPKRSLLVTRWRKEAQQPKTVQIHICLCLPFLMSCGHDAAAAPKRDGKLTS